jgi:hypothetical protein
MGAAASVSVGNRTESNVTNSTSNEQYFSMENLVNIVNTMEQKTASVNAIVQDYGMESLNKAKVKLKNTTIKIGGEGNKVAISASTSAVQAIESIADAVAVVEHSATLKDAVMFDIANNGFSMQSSDMTSAATASSTTELECSGIGCAAASVGINNTVCTNVNNSIRNVFNMAINNNMSSATQRNSLAESINSAKQLVNMVNSNEAGVEMDGVNIDVGGKCNTFDASASAMSGSNAVSQSAISSNMKSSLVAETSNIASATSTVEAGQTAKSSATAAASQTQSTKVSTDAALGIIAGVAVVGLICGTIVIGIRCSGKNNKTKDDDKKEGTEMVTESLLKKNEIR